MGCADVRNECDDRPYDLRAGGRPRSEEGRSHRGQSSHLRVSQPNNTVIPYQNYSYFLHLEPESGWEEDEQLAYKQETAQHLMAFNGWVMSDNPLKNFALPDSEVEVLKRQ